MLSLQVLFLVDVSEGITLLWLAAGGGIAILAVS